MACQTTFGTMELLEDILLPLPLPDLLRVQAVCKRWQDVITTSSVLQEKLFYKAAKADSAWLVDVTNLPSGMGPLHRRYETEVRVRATVSVISTERTSHYGLLVAPVQINPLCLRREDDSDEDCNEDCDKETGLDYDANYGTPINVLPKFFEAEYATGPWQRMLITQPPVQYVTVDSGPYHASETLNDSPPGQREFAAGQSTKLFVEGGVRVGDIILAISKIGGSSSDEDHAIYMHGAIAVSDGYTKQVKHRTKEWRESLAASDDGEEV